MTFRAKLFLAVLVFATLPLGYCFGMAEYMSGPLLIAIFCVCCFTLLGTLAGAVKVDQLVKSSEERAFRSEVELQSFLERIHDGVFRIDAAGRILEINSALAQALQYEPDFLKSRNLQDYLQSGQGAPKQSWFRPGQIRCTLPMLGKLKGGGSSEFIVDLYAQREGGDFCGFRGCARPAEKLLKKEKLKEQLAGELFGSLGQHLRTFLHDLEEIPAMHADIGAARVRLEEAAARLSRQLGVFSAENGLTDWTPSLRMRPLDPQQLLAHVCARFKAAMGARSQTLVRNAFGEGAGFKGDFDYLAELLGNLLANAVKYAPDEGEIVVTYREAEDVHGFAVSDSGVGMSQEDLSRVFSPFFRAENSVNSRIPGLGLGLWMAHRIAEAHRGRLMVESELGKGSTFSLILPKASSAPNVKWVD